MALGGSPQNVLQTPNETRTLGNGRYALNMAHGTRFPSRTSTRTDSDVRPPGPGLLPLLLPAAAVAAYANSFSGAFVFDSVGRILLDPTIRRLWPLGDVLSRRRPVVDYSLAVNFAIGDGSAWGYRACNVAIHALAALTLFGIVRRTLLRPGLRERFAGAASWLALAVALIWVVHPLQTQAVTYLIQRAESMMGLFYLLTLYCVIRGLSARRCTGWYIAAVIACAFGMGSKAVMITAPVAVWLYDRCFVTHSWTKSLRERWGLYVGLAATWLVLVATGTAGGVLSPSSPHAHVGFGFKGIGPVEYALTQFGVLTRYLHLSLWPQPLCLDYGWPVARTLDEIVPPLIVIAALLWATLWALRRHPALGFVGAWFFLVLAPTSTFIPIKDPAFEHRVYLSLAGVVVLMVLGGYGGLRVLHRLSAARCRSGTLWGHGLSLVILALTVSCLGYATVRRNATYQADVVMWRDVVSKRPLHARGQDGLGSAFFEIGRLQEALRAYRRAVELDPNYAEAHFNVGTALVSLGRADEGMAAFRDCLDIDAEQHMARVSLGNGFASLGDMERAIAVYRETLRRDSSVLAARVNLGNALLQLGRVDEAVSAFRDAIRIDPDRADTRYNLGNALLRRDDVAGALAAYREAIRIEPDHRAAYAKLGRVLLDEGRIDAAMTAFREGARLSPNPSDGYVRFGTMLASRGYRRQAIDAFYAALEITPQHAGARQALDAAIASQAD